MTFDMQAARELCEKASFRLTGNEIDEDLKTLVDQAAMLPAALDRIEELQADNIRKDGLIGRLMREGNDMPKTIAELESALQVEKSAHEETKYADAETSNRAFSRIAKQHAALQKLGQAKRARGKALIEERAGNIKMPCRYDGPLTRCDYSGTNRGWCKDCLQKERIRGLARDQLRREGLL